MHQQSQDNVEQYKSFKEFYPFYLSQHQNLWCRRFHYLGSTIAIAFIIAAFYFSNGWFLLYALLAGYGCAWVGHFFFEKNRPATFSYPIYSFIGDWKMFFNKIFNIKS
ncbi:DUF962 domain-containing protein [Endozoicomonas sp. G2_1]|uniref:DUF962 domain-containing protein n=1 Tax=Endozoicomonas sp. G2_1 TaxID=2821091 RepID=UPI001ADCD592|nr:DUF962 domain-containing protein [Endozoicomonas sp. G2_1]MBO9488862.1 DUF962 domain-containing protein [Endozoicomonas sp. G2_1]